MSRVWLQGDQGGVHIDVEGLALIRQRDRYIDVEGLATVGQRDRYIDVEGLAPIGLT